MHNDDLQKAIKDINEGDRSDAIRVVRDIIRKDPNNIQLLLRITQEVNNPRIITGCLKRILWLDPENKVARKSLYSHVLSTMQSTNVDSVPERVLEIEWPPEAENSSILNSKNVTGNPASIEELNLTINQFVLLHKAGTKTIAELYSLLRTSFGLTLFDNKQIQAIKSIIEDYENRNPKPILSEQIQGAYDGNGHLLALQGNITPIEHLHLSVRCYRSLKRAGVATVGELSTLSNNFVVASIQGIGEKSEAEIDEQLLSFSRNPEKYSQQINGARTDISERIITNSFVDIELVKKASTIPLRNIPIERLILNEYIIGELRKANILYIGDFYIQYQPSLNYEFIKHFLELYLYWIIEQDQSVWENEINNIGLSPVHSAVLRETNLDDLFKKWFSPLNKREQYVIQNRSGISDKDQTLEEISNEFGLTRERIRQIQKRAENKLFNPQNCIIIEPLRALYFDWIKSLGGLVSNERLSKYTASIAGNSQSTSLVMGQYILKFSEEIKWLKAIKAWGHYRYPLDQINLIQQEFERVLYTERTGLPIKVLFSRFKATEVYIKNLEDTPRKFFISCLLLSPTIEVDNKGECKLTKWSGRRLDEMIQALRQIGVPVHYSEIAKRTNTFLPIDQQATPRIIHAHISRCPDIFVRVGHGVFGLAEWGLLDDGSIANAVVRVLDEESQLLSLDRITSRVLENWRVNAGSVHMAIVNDDRIIKCNSEQYGLTKWDLMNRNSQEEDLLSWIEEWSEE